MRIDDPEVHLMRNDGKEGFSFNPERLSTGSHSGFQGLNLTALTGPEIIILVGYDARDPKKDEKWHWFGDHPARSPTSVFATYRASFRKVASTIAAAGIRVLNCSPGSAIDAFEKMALEDALAL